MPVSQPPSTLSSRRRIQARPVLVYALLCLSAAIFLLPIFWMLSSSLKPEWQVLANPPVWIPNPPRWENYREALTYLPFGRYAVNTLIISLGAIVGHVLSCTIVAYGFARLRAPGKNFFFLLLLSTLMLPYPVTMVPLFVLFNALGWINTFLPLIIPTFFGNAFYIFLLRQFFLTLPPDLEDAAQDRRRKHAASAAPRHPADLDARAGDCGHFHLPGQLERFPPALDLPAGPVPLYLYAGPELLPWQFPGQMVLPDGRVAGGRAAGGHRVFPGAAAVHQGDRDDGDEGVRSYRTTRITASVNNPRMNSNP